MVVPLLGRVFVRQRVLYCSRFTELMQTSCALGVKLDQTSASVLPCHCLITLHPLSASPPPSTLIAGVTFACSSLVGLGLVTRWKNFLNESSGSTRSEYTTSGADELRFRHCRILPLAALLSASLVQVEV